VSLTVRCATGGCGGCGVCCPDLQVRERANSDRRAAAERRTKGTAGFTAMLSELSELGELRFDR
jgi:hypothetical protein